MRALSLRGLAASLGIAPNALYRYFANRAELEAAMAAESARRLYLTLSRAAGKKEPGKAIRQHGRCVRQICPRALSSLPNVNGAMRNLL